MATAEVLNPRVGHGSGCERTSPSTKSKVQRFPCRAMVRPCLR